MSNTSSITKPLDKVVETLATAIQQWEIDNSPSIIESKVRHVLDKNLQEITLKLLGFSNNWGRWELDHCNGRSGESAVGDYLRQIQKEAIDKWLSTIEIPPLTQKMRKELGTHARNEYFRALEHHITDMAVDQATEDAKKILDSVLSTDRHEAMIKLTKLLTNTQ